MCLFHITPSFPGAKGNRHSPYPIQLQAHSEWEYFNKREAFKIFSLLKNPMVLMMGFSVIMMFALPKVILWFLIYTYITIIIILIRATYHPPPPPVQLMDNVDPETKKELETMQAEGGLLNAFKRATSEATQSSEATAVASQGISQTSASKKKRK